MRRGRSYRSSHGMAFNSFPFFEEDECEDEEGNEEIMNRMATAMIKQAEIIAIQQDMLSIYNELNSLHDKLAEYQEVLAQKYQELNELVEFVIE